MRLFQTTAATLITLCASCTFLFALSAQGASFDCGKAKSKVEKLICGDSELSALDEEMGVLYREILQNSSNDPELKKAQRDWIGYRQQCLTTYRVKQDQLGCVIERYRRHNNILRGSLPSEPDAGKDAQQLCTRISSLVETGEALDLPNPEYEDGPPRNRTYKFDIDQDGKVDSMEVGCGSSECGVEIKLSSDNSYDLGSLEGYGFYLIRYQFRVYALVGSSEDEESNDPKIYTKSHLYRLYLIEPSGAKMVCGN